MEFIVETSARHAHISEEHLKVGACIREVF